MKYVAAALLLQLGNSQTISKAAITELLKSVGIEADQDRLNAFMSKVEGKDINELINAGLGKMATFSIGSGGAAAPAPSEQAGGAAEVKEEAKEEEKEESDGDFGFGLFD